MNLRMFHQESVTLTRLDRIPPKKFEQVRIVTSSPLFAKVGSSQEA